MKKIIKCVVCKSENIKKHIISKDFSVTNEEFKIDKCLDCGFVFTNPIPKEKDLPKYYISKNYISHTNSNKSFFDKIYQSIRSIAIKDKFNLINSFDTQNKILDIGSGTGEFLNYCKLNGWKVKGIEPSKIARVNSIKKYQFEVDEDTDLRSQSGEYDIITMWHVLEHVYELENTIIELKRLLKENGKLIIAVPNLNSYDAQYYKKYWAAYDLPIHLYHFSKKSITKLFGKHQFNLLKDKGMIFDSFYVSLLSEEYKTGKKNFITASIIGALSNVYGAFSKKGFSSTIYIFEHKNR